MSGESPKKVSRGNPRNLDAGSFQPMVDSWDLHLRAEKKSPKTIRTYLEAAQWLAAEYLIPAGFADWDEVRAKHVQEWIIILLGRYSDSYANNQFRALQQFFKWHATEDPDEPPQPDGQPQTAKDRRQARSRLRRRRTGRTARHLQGRWLPEPPRLRHHLVVQGHRRPAVRAGGLATGDVSPREREAVVTGKGDKQRTVKFTYDTARALDRYQRERARHKMARMSALWLGVRGPMTASGVYQVIERRGLDAGVEVNPHKFRHTFSHVFLDRGGAEGDLMELNGWTSPQMLARYGRSARSARARRHYDDVMGA